MSQHIYKTIELVGSSTVGVEDAIQKAIAKAAETVRNLRWFEVTETRGHIEGERVSSLADHAEDRVHARGWRLMQPRES